MQRPRSAREVIGARCADRSEHTRGRRKHRRPRRKAATTIAADLRSRCWLRRRGQLLTTRLGSVHDRGGCGLFDPGVGHFPARLRDFLAVLVGMEVHDSAAVDPDDVGARVHVRLSGLGSRVRDPLDADEEIPRRSGNEHALNVEAEVVQPEQALEPAANRVAGMALAAQRVIAREDVVNIVREPIEGERVVAAAQSVEDATNPPTDEGVEHDLKIVRRRLQAPAQDHLHASPFS